MVRIRNKNQNQNLKRMKKTIYLGGTLNSNWREELKKYLSEWTIESSKEKSNIVLHAFTPESDNIVELTDLAGSLVKNPKKIIIVFFEYGGLCFDEKVDQYKELGKVVDEAGGHWALTMLEVIHLLTSKEELC